MLERQPRWGPILRCLLVPLLMLAAMPLAGAANAWDGGATPVFRHVSMPSDISPTALLQDREGLIWIASQTGLVSWDGYRFRTYISDPGMPDSLPSSYVNALYEDHDNRLWVGTDSGGLARLDRITGRFWKIGAGAGGLSSPRVFALAPDGANGLWVGTGAGLDRLDFATGKVRRQADGATPPGLPAERVNALLVDRLDNLWVGTFKGLYVLRAGSRSFQPVPTAIATSDAIEIWQLAEDKSGRIWVSTRGTGAFVVEPGTFSARQVRDSEHLDGKGLESDWVVSIVDAGGDRVWLGTWAQGIVQVDTRTWATRQLRHDPAVPGSIAMNDVPALLRDRSGLVWAGGPNLLDSIDPTQRAISTWYGNDGYLSVGTRAEVTSVLVRPDGSVWFGSDNGGLDIVPPDGSRGRHLVPQDGQPRTALPGSAVLAMAGTPDGAVYIGTAKGLYRTRDDGHSVERVDLAGLSVTALIRALCVDGDRMWIGGASGLVYVDRIAQGGKAESVPTLQGEDVDILDRAEDGSLWVGTATGLLRYWPKTGRVEQPWPEQPGRVGLPGAHVTSVVRDKRGRLWVSYYGAGVRVIEPQPGGAAVRIRRIGHNQGLRNNAANALLLDADGNAWVSTDSGILRIDGDTLTATLLQQANGVGLLPYWTASAGTTPRGDLLFGGDGLTIVHPSEFQPSRFKAPIMLTAQDGQPISPMGITLGPSLRSLQVGFALLDYTAPERTRYAYRLAGLEDGWTDSPAELRIAHYTNLPPGNYTLQVRASNRAGEWTASVNLPVRVVPAWYETTTFRVLLAVLLVALVVALMQLRTRLLRSRAAALETLIAQRTQELQQRSDELVLRTAELQASEQRLEQLAYFDGLTGLANRRHFNDDLQHMVEQMHRGGGFALVLVDLDRFKPINDLYGHDAGDAVLKTVASRLGVATRDADLVARLGGDEFAVLLTHPGDRDNVAAVCERIIATIAQPISHEALSLEVSASIGVALCPQDAPDAMSLYKAADLALYAAKEGGRGVWRWAGEDLEV